MDLENNFLIKPLSQLYRDNMVKLSELKRDREQYYIKLNNREYIAEMKHKDYVDLEKAYKECEKLIEDTQNYIDGVHDAREIIIRIVQNSGKKGI